MSAETEAAIQIVTANSSWEELNDEVCWLKAEWPERPIWQMMKKKPITPQAIQDLLSNGCEVFEAAFTGGGTCSYRTDGRIIIYISSELSPFIRDLTLCHEIVHAQYPVPQLLGENFHLSLCQKDRMENELITEWYARKLRANPRILRAIAKQFGGEKLYDYTFKPVIYDKATFLAFGLHDYDLDKAINRCPKPLKEIPLLMDPPTENFILEPKPIPDENDYEHYDNLLI